MDDQISLSTTDDGVRHIRLNRPRSLNAMTEQMKVDLTDVIHDSARDRTVRAVVLEGSGRAFCAGSDVKEMAHFGPEDAERMLTAEHAMFDAVLRLEKPVIAAVQGYAMGAGFQLAICADVMICTADTRFGMPELGFGAVNGNETALLLPLGGLTLMRRMILGQEIFTCSDLAFTGCLSSVVPDADTLSEKVGEVARALAATPGGSYGRQKRLILGWLDMAYSSAVNSSIADAAAGWGDAANIDAMKHALS